MQYAVQLNFAVCTIQTNEIVILMADTIDTSKTLSSKIQIAAERKKKFANICCRERIKFTSSP